MDDASKKSKPIRRKIQAGAAAGGYAGVVAILIAHYLDLPDEVATAWGVLITGVAQYLGAWWAQDEEDD